MIEASKRTVIIINRSNPTRVDVHPLTTQMIMKGI